MPTAAERTPLTEPTHIYLDPQGVAWIGHTNIKVTEIVIDSTALSMTPEQVRDNYGDVTLAQIHAALAYYHDHKDALDAEIAAREANAERLRMSARNQLVRVELEARLHEQRSADRAA